MESLNIIFAGTSQFAEIALEKLIHSHHKILAVYTQPDRKAGRGLKLKASPVKALATHYQIPLYQPNTLKDTKEEERLNHLNADVMVVAAYGILLPANILRIPRLGCINIHPSLLPRWRGAAPIQRTLFSGDQKTGVTIMQMDEGLDTGAILMQKECVIDPNETAQTLHDKLAILGAKTLIETLNELAKGTIKAKPQDNLYATYAQKLSKEEALIDWQQSAISLEQEIRAFNPWPIAYTSWRGQSLRIFVAKALSSAEQNARPRTIVHAAQDGLDIATGEGILRLLFVQLPGGKILSIADFYNAHHKELIEGEPLI